MIMEKTVDFTSLMEAFEENYNEEQEQNQETPNEETPEGDGQESTEEVEESTEDASEGEEGSVEDTEESNEVAEQEQTQEETGEYVKLSKDNHNKLVEKNQKLDGYLREEHEFIRKLAQASGYTTVKEFKEAAMKQVNKKKAEAQGLPVEAYEKMQQQEMRINQMEQAQANAHIQIKQKEVFTSIKNTFDEYEVPEKQRAEILNELESKGVNLKTLMAIPDPSLLIKGALSGKTLQKKAEKIVNTQKKIDNLDTETHSKGAKDINSEFDDFDDYMANFAENNGLEYKRGK